MIDAAKDAARISAHQGRQTPAIALAPFQEKQRGLFSFITWPFFLAQAFTTADLLGENFRIAKAEEDVSNAVKPGSSEGIYDDNGSSAAFVGTTDLGEPESDTATARALVPPIEFSNAAIRSDSLNDDHAAEEAPEAVVHGGGGNPIAVDFLGIGRTLAQEPNLGSTRAESGYPPMSDAAFTSFLETNLQFASEIEAAALTGPLFQLSGPVLGAAVGVVGSLAHGAVDTLEPIVDTVGQTLSVATDIVSDISSDLLGTIEPVVEVAGPVLGATASVVGSLANNAVETLGPIVDAVGQTISVAADVVGDISGVPVATVGSVVEAAGPILGTAASVVTDIADNVVEAIEPTVEIVGQTLSVAADSIGNPAGDVVSMASSIDAVSPILAISPIAPLELVGQLGGGADLEPEFAANPSAASAPDGVDDVTGRPLDSTSASIGDFAETLAGSASSVSSLITLGDVASDGAITLEDDPELLTSADALFADGRYSDYGVTLSTEATEDSSLSRSVLDPQGPVGAPSATATDQKARDSEEAGTPVDSNENVLNGMTPLGHDLTSTLDDLGLR